MADVSCDIFCTVIDNFGDAGVCWRLARQLASEQGWSVRLIIDKPETISQLAPDQQLVEVIRWEGGLEGVDPAQVVIEAFACHLPTAYVAAMSLCRKPPVWLNLEYLTAEDWIGGCHGLPSPQAGLNKYFFFPGYVPGSGGLLREHDFAATAAPSFDGPLEISLFCYANPQMPVLLAAWRDGDRPIHCQVCDGIPRQQVEAWLGSTIPAKVGNLTLSPLPFLPQTAYDSLLGSCHLNFVRGEDSLVSAQWAERPFVWQAYPQADNAHLIKLDAFLERYTEKVDLAATAICRFMRAWNGSGQLDWPELAANLPALSAHAPRWASHLKMVDDLATNLVKFCALRL